MIVNRELASSTGCLEKDLWETPQDLYDSLNDEFHFTLDPCATDESAKCTLYITPKENGLILDWDKETCFVNPPYSRGNIDQWVRKCYMEHLKGATVVALLPVSTSSKWFHDWVYKKADIRFLKGRIKFKGAKHNAPFSSMIAIYKIY